MYLSRGQIAVFWFRNLINLLVFFEFLSHVCIFKFLSFSPQHYEKHGLKKYFSECFLEGIYPF